MNYNSLAIILWSLLASITLGQSLLCPDQTTKCGDDMTCCKWHTGRYGCCPLSAGLCCADGLHCCPNGTKCNDKEGTCDELAQSTTGYKLVLENSGRSLPKKLDDMCPDRNSTCASWQTCCKEKSGSYGCCPYDSGVCCKDMLHCCPHGSTCDLVHQECIRTVSDNTISDLTDGGDRSRTGSVKKWRMRLIGSKAANVTDVVCPGGRYQCPDGNTCCRVTDTQWGCCPMPNAVCCADHVHCCPNHMRCTPTGCVQQ
ncbi:progranulin-like [Oppia nitens]|uniref:progranulin-like n=1 Tax=Oppia nitens TaxID=1686743 RepID=UPI0023DA9BC2|nr:progranulin-like [Oppia nitens]